MRFYATYKISWRKTSLKKKITFNCGCRRNYETYTQSKYIGIWPKSMAKMLPNYSFLYRLVVGLDPVIQMLVAWPCVAEICECNAAPVMFLTPWRSPFNHVLPPLPLFKFQLTRVRSKDIGVMNTLVHKVTSNIENWACEPQKNEGKSVPKVQFAGVTRHPWTRYYWSSHFLVSCSIPTLIRSSDVRYTCLIRECT